jgi:diguanylate cyclase (GGDEF)-like protein
VVAVATLASAGSAGLCYGAYYLLGIPLFPSGAVGKVLQLAPILTPILVAPGIACPQIRSAKRVARLLAEVESTRTELMAEVVERQAAQARLEELARRDPLTGLLNRRGFFESWATGEEWDDPVLVTVDLDHFKAINDAYGHAAGDQVLRATAETLRALCGDSARVARIGGDEFAVLMPWSAGCLASLVDGLSAICIPVSGASTTMISASVGAARPARGATVDDVLAYADESMYTAKRERAATELLGVEPTAWIVGGQGTTH